MGVLLAGKLAKLDFFLDTLISMAVFETEQGQILAPNTSEPRAEFCKWPFIVTVGSAKPQVPTTPTWA